MMWPRIKNALTTLEIVVLGAAVIWGTVTAAFSLIEALRAAQ